MPERKKRKIIIASTLKPVDDTRMFEKIGASLADSGAYEVFIIGFPSQKPIAYPSINFLPLPGFRRISLSRFLAPWRILRTVCSIKPEILIICTHELLFVAVFYKMFFQKKKILYDVHENYFRNILFIPSFSFLVRPILAAYVRMKEVCLAPFIDYFILAERGYEKELCFPGNKKIVIENKLKKPVQPASKKSAEDGLIHLLFSGTLAETTGIFQAIELSKQLHAAEPRIRLTILGYCTQGKTLKKIKQKIQDAAFIELIGGDQLVPHTRILEAIQRSDAGIISYPPNPSTRNSIPTKLYEYLGCYLPILVADHPTWVEYCIRFHAGISINFKNPDADGILHQLKTGNFYTTKPADVFWETEGKKLMALLHQLTPG